MVFIVFEKVNKLGDSVEALCEGLEMNKTLKCFYLGCKKWT